MRRPHRYLADRAGGGELAAVRHAHHYLADVPGAGHQLERLPACEIPKVCAGNGDNRPAASSARISASN